MRTALFLVAVAALQGCAAPSLAERNKAVARRAFSEILEKGRFDLVDELYAKDFRNHGTLRDGDLAEDMEALRVLKSASPPDSTMRPELIVAEGDYVSVLWRAAGTIRGRPMNLRGITIWKILDGKIRDEWSEFDELGLKRELGLVAPEGSVAK